MPRAFLGRSRAGEIEKKRGEKQSEKYFSFSFMVFTYTFRSRTGLSAVDCFYIGKHLNSGGVYSLAIEWLTEATKRFDEYYDQHQVNAVDILEEIARSFVGSNRMEEAEKVVEKVLRMNASSEVGKLLKNSAKSTILNVVDSTNNTLVVKTQRFCHSRHFLLYNIFSCSI